MFFSAKSKGYFVDSSEHAVFVARTSSGQEPFVIEEILESEPKDTAGLRETIKTLQPTKSQSGYLPAACGITSPRRAVRRITIEPKRLKEPTYLGETTAQQLKIEPDKYSLVALNPLTGQEYDMVKAGSKDMLICGLPTDELISTQDKLLESGIYPVAIEMGSIATLGALVDYLNFAKIKTPVLMLEIEEQSTNSYIVSSAGLEASRSIPHGLESMIPFVQKELGLKDEAAARKLFLSNAFDFTGMGSILIKKVIKELQSSIGFYEVQTGLSIGQMTCTVLPAKLAWLENAIATDLGVTVLKPDLPAWLQSHAISLADHLTSASQDVRRLGLLGLMIQFNNSHVVASEKV